MLTVSGGVDKKSIIIIIKREVQIILWSFWTQYENQTLKLLWEIGGMNIWETRGLEGTNLWNDNQILICPELGWGTH